MSDDFCLGFVAGLAVAGIVGFISQQLYLSYKKMGEAARPQKIIAKTEKTPSQVIQRSIAAFFWFIFLLVALAVLLWLGAQYLF